MAEEFRIERYRRSDRERVFELLCVARPSDSAARLIRQWDWKYDANPFNREAEQYRRTNREELLAHMRATYSAERLENFRRRWGMTAEEEPVERYDDPYVLLLKKDGQEVAG